MGSAHPARMHLYCRWDRRFARNLILPLLSAVLVFHLLVPSPALATDRHWTGATDTTWGLATNWDTLAPLSTDNAVFGETFTGPVRYQSNLAIAATVGGIWMTTGVRQNMTISGSTLTLNGNSINGTSNLGILVDNWGAFTLTINAPLTLGNNQTWLNNSGNLLTIGSGGVNTNGKSLTVNGSGNTTISGVISNNGSLTKNGTGTLLLSSTNSYTGTTTVTAGALLVNGSLASGSAVTVNGSGTLLGGTGTINGSVSVATSGTILEGGTGSTGQTLTIKGSLTQTTGSIIELALGSSLSHSTLALTSAGASSFYSTQKFRFIELAGVTTGTYHDIITGVTSDPGVGSWTITNFGSAGSFFYDSTDQGIDLTLTAIPEPSTWAAGALAAFGVVLMLRTRLRQLIVKGTPILS